MIQKSSFIQEPLFVQQAMTGNTEEEIARMKANAARVTVVNFEGESTGYGHSYFRTNPAVSSDLVLMIRYGFKPGEAGRPLEHIGLNFWRVPANYPDSAEIK
jgi:hypothetical protein